MLNQVQIGQMVNESIKYTSDVREAEEEAQLLSTDYLRGYIESYETNRGVIKRTLTRVGNALDLATESPKIVGFRKTLENRTSSE